MTGTRTIAVIVVAAGRGERASSTADASPKQYRDLAGTPVLSRSIAAFLGRDDVSWVIPVIHAEQADRYAALGLADPRLLAPVTGGKTRQASVLAGLTALSPKRPDLVLIQDAARPLVSSEVIGGVIEALKASEAALPVVPVTDTIKRSVDGRTVSATEDRKTLFAAQTPQGFRFPQILSAHLRAGRMPREFTDDAAIAEWAGLSVALTPGSTHNLKITHPEDFARAERLLGRETRMETRIGTGFDVHPFDTGNSVWLGGVEIPHTHKLKGHSDADVALHALTDAIYGALGEGDIGKHFPPSDPQWKGAASSIFLKHAASLVGERHGRIVNLDITIVCEAPRVGPHVEAMKAAISGVCGISAGRVAIKATTSEQLGFTGRGEGIVAMASASIELPRED
ncbi:MULTISPECIES: bifunctional 2-C-methyl-D-erythritol 4-phosphate cytidylyltransferase/2-C-methyl-D-erythritol 2,4-cyclodiphosphate synthase [unclassified Devosia]|uniref:bifunctional 2-C-methyl-D-erythritol 4-phosphate cytidylyltransferase/2-C-methyl-D-erythritol 2,4-cyclodiphosphate synthase n=1 Tax=unclassified Devosia TaxID=196773 RepID=UPI00086D411A|nr:MULTISPECIES: bifunctional 2-C-methyl-D-erythritol 4-phosphate cytidylyltransferase/2-C-methyl-D-erythritol 2,4-cyclodiphosphate synthase [unclassified Devosia]MBN9361514.1 bifunctional 2-C-methyl-D-erythritol 4-phosphate cytidylyltransferase/2-C-methyl-D-erythritol 2,4-cyclodiphosphate synthase [Devosia sp.]ODS94601.1 MAG: bifunctional 2-C-methyl-D-erythritol 4-phosphate cytidylyltransferase/2-C-methyl-D-erythritol 2,4-cyclodiphosphate synthase [Devosia sp. SCN 66-27]OJX26576.1 MAG: bifuncti